MARISRIAKRMQKKLARKIEKKELPPVQREVNKIADKRYILAGRKYRRAK